MDMSLISGMPEVIAYIRSQDESIKSLKEGKLSKFQCDKCKGHHTGCANPTCDSCVKEIEEENEKLKNTIVSLKSSVDDLREARDMRDHQIDDWHKALNEPVEGLEHLQSGINLHFWQRCSGPWDDDIDKINQN